MGVKLIGKKLGMTRVFSDDGSSVAVSVIQVLPNRVTQVKTEQADGYNAVQLASGDIKGSHLNRAEKGLFAKAGVAAGSNLHEFRLPAGEGDIEYKVGDELSIALFADVSKVDVVGASKGKGFAGGVKRWNFGMQDATHGNSISHRAIGSTGQCQTPGRVLKGKKMPGHMGAVRSTCQALKVVDCKADDGLLFVKGAIPGKSGGDVMVSISTRG